MILVDTSVWIDHLRRADPGLQSALETGRVMLHPFVIGEMACGTLAERSQLLGLLKSLPQATVAEDEEVLILIDRQRLHGKGIGYIDAHLLTSVALTTESSLWTRDKRLLAVAKTVGCAHRETPAH